MRRTRSVCSLPVATAAAISATAVILATPVSAQETRELVMSAEFDTRPGARLVIDVPDADLVLRNGGSDRVVFEIYVEARDIERGRNRFEAMNFRAEGNAQEVTLRADRERNTNWDWRRWGGFTVIVEATVPEEYNADVRTEDGDVAVQSLSGEVRLRSSDGDITADSLNGNVVISTSDGDIGVRRMIGGKIEVTTSDGDVSLGELQATSIAIDTSDSDISGDRLAAGGIEAHTSDGDIVFSAIAGPVQDRRATAAFISTSRSSERPASVPAMATSPSAPPRRWRPTWTCAVAICRCAANCASMARSTAALSAGR